VTELDSAVEGEEGFAAGGTPALSFVGLVGEELQLLRVTTIAPTSKGAKYFLRQFITKLKSRF
jgi:hypothetical protein